MLPSACLVVHTLRCFCCPSIDSAHLTKGWLIAMAELARASARLNHLIFQCSCISRLYWLSYPSGGRSKLSTSFMPPWSWRHSNACIADRYLSHVCRFPFLLMGMQGCVYLVDDRDGLGEKYYYCNPAKAPWSVFAYTSRLWYQYRHRRSYFVGH